MSATPGRNEPCHCGSGNKYKKCCAEKDEATRVAAAAAHTASVAAAAAALAAGEPPPAPKTVVAPKSRVQPHGVSNRAPPPARRRSV